MDLAKADAGQNWSWHWSFNDQHHCLVVGHDFVDYWAIKHLTIDYDAHRSAAAVSVVGCGLGLGRGMRVWVVGLLGSSGEVRARKAILLSCKIGFCVCVYSESGYF